MLKDKEYKWDNEPKNTYIDENRVEIITDPHTDLWQKTFGSESADNAPMLLWESEDEIFVFTVKVVYESRGLYDQAGIILHKDENTWLKASMECEEDIKHLGSVATNRGFSDWASVDVPADKTTMWYRLTRNGDDYLLEYSEEGEQFSVLRMCHMWDIGKSVRFGIYACSPRESSFKAVFTDFDYKKE